MSEFRRFTSKFEVTEGTEEIAFQNLKRFISDFQKKILSFTPGEAENYKIQNAEEIENIILRSLYSKVLKIMNCPEKDDEFNLKMRYCTFIKAEHLELSPEKFNSDSLKQARNFLEKMNKLKTPKEKFICLINGCKIVGGLLTLENQGYGADDFLPALIFCILHTSIRNIYRELKYIKLDKKNFFETGSY